LPEPDSGADTGSITTGSYLYPPGWLYTFLGTGARFVFELEPVCRLAYAAASAVER